MNEFEFLKNKEIIFALRKAIKEISNASFVDINSYLEGEGYDEEEINKLLFKTFNEDRETNEMIEIINKLRNFLIEISEAALMNPIEFLLGEGYDEEEIKDILE
jgi:c-di-AMP phosphodiesterase-like protein